MSSIGLAVSLVFSVAGTQFFVVAASPASADPAGGPAALTSTTPGAITAGTVPDGTCRAAVVGLGGAGASSGTATTAGGIGAPGARISATLAVLPGQAYSGSVAGGGTLTAGGVGGGGAPGTIVNSHRGGGGGGRTELSIAGSSVLVAGGGGGGGAAHQLPPNGNAGAAGLVTSPGVAVAGSNGTNGVDNPNTITVGGGVGGVGGGVATGGAGGVNSNSAAQNGSSGTGIGTGAGGNGGPDANFDSAGGGGGGYTGGGGGASTVNSSVTGGGGGGGSSWVVATSPTVSAGAPTGVGGSAGATPAGGAVAGANGSLSVDWLPCQYDLALTKTVATSPVIAGGTVTWTIKVTNNGPDPMTKGDTLDLTDTLPVGPNGPATPAFKVLSVATSGGTNTDMASGALSCTGVTVGSSMPAATNCSRAYSAPSAPGAPSGGTRGLNVGETLTITYEQNISSSATCPATITNTATVKDRPTTTGTTDVVGVTTTDTVATPLAITCFSVTKLRLVKALSGSRLSNTDQFTMAIAPSGAPASGGSATTTGSGATVTANTGVVTVATATAGLSYTFSETMAAGSLSALSQYGPSVSCTNAATGSPTVLPASGSPVVPFSITPTVGDDITCTVTNAPLASSLSIVKATTSTGYSAVGATIPYTFVVRNTGAVTLNSITITDPMVTGISCPVTTLAPGASTTCTASHTVTQADLDAVSVVNTASVTGTPPGGSAIPSTSSNTVTVAATQTPSITITKSTVKTSFSAIGESIPYSFVVRNTGNVTLTAVAVTDPKTSGVSCAASSLAPGLTTSCTGTHTVTVADLDAGSVVNTATVVATRPSGTPLAPTSSNTVTVPAVQSPNLSIVKASATSSYSSVGQTISYTFTVRNTGNVTLTSVAVTDPNVTAISCPLTTLAPGVATTCTGSHTVTLTDLNAGSVVNTASVRGTPPSGSPTAPVSSNTVTVPAAQNPQLTIVKSTPRLSYATLGESVPYAFAVTNTGNVTLTAVTVTDPLVPGTTCPATTLAPGASTTCTGSHTVTQADLDGGTIVNTASVVATPPSGTPLSPISSNTVTIPAAQDPRITIVKSTTKTSYSTLGETVPYSFAVTNTGNVTLNAVAVADPKATGISCPSTALAPGAATTCTGTHTVTQADLDAGTIVNTATVTATPPTGPPLTPVSSNTVTVPATQSPNLSIAKTTTTANFSAAGQTIAYSFTVTNTGNLTLTAITVTDPKTSGVTCTATSLAPGASATCTGSHVTTAADVSAGSVVNTATTTGSPPSGSPIPPVPSNTVTVPLSASPSLTIAKSTATSSYATAGSSIGYSFAVTNTGNVALTSLVVADPNTAGVSCAATSLAIGASTTCTGTHTVTQSDLDTGSIVNTAAARATTPSGTVLTPLPSNTVTIPAAQSPSVAIVKSTTTTSVNAVGSSIPYVFRLTNTGNVTLTALSVSDPNASGLSCPSSSLAPGASTNCTGTHTVTQADLDAGAIVNTAAARATPPSGSPLAPTGSNTVTVPVAQAASLTIVKATSTSSYTAAGQVISYTLQVTNTGNVTMDSIVVTDPNASGIACPSATLAPGAAMTCTASHTTTQADMNTGTVVNTAGVLGTPPSGSPISPVSSNTVTVPGTQTPRLSVAKSTTKPSITTPGESINYTFTVTNTGNVTISSPTVTDPILTAVTCPSAPLDPGQSATCTGTDTVTQADLDAGSVVNQATASGTTPSGASLPPVGSNTVTVPAVQSPRLTIVKSTTKSAFSTVGETIPYRFVVTNTGNVNLTAVAVTDGIAGTVSCSPTSLAPGQAVTCTANRAATQADLDAGSIINTASVTATPPSGTPLAPVSSNTVTVNASQAPALSLTKSTPATSYSTLGESIAYDFVATNTGNVTLTGVTIADPKVDAITCAASTLVPTASTTCRGTHLVTQADLDSGSIVNTAAVTGTPPGGSPVAPVPSNTVTISAAQNRALTVTKATTTSSFAALGDSIPYTFAVTNTGNVTMNSITVIDARVAAIACPSTSLAPGASTTCSGTHSVSQADLDGGSVINTAAVTGTPTGGSAISPVPSNTVTVPAVQSPAMAITKASTSSAYSAVNETIPYTFVVTNTGNVTVSAVTVTDPNLLSVSCSSSVLAPGASTPCSGTHLVTQADLDRGSLANTAAVVATPPAGSPIAPVPSNTVTIPATQSPALTIAKATGTGSYAAVGATVSYTFRVVNTGNVTLTAITINDPNIAGFTCTRTTLAGGEAADCNGTHSVVQADIDAGSIVNTATVTATPPSGTPLAPVGSNTVTVPARQSPGLSIAKSSATTAYAAVGDPIAYSFMVTNIGNVTISNITVTDIQTASVTCPSTSLLVATAMTCTGTHTVTQSDLNTGYVANTASVTGTPPSGPALTPVPSNTVIVNATVSPALTIVKADGGAPITRAGDVITYTATVTNTGNVTLSLIKVDDPKAPDLTCPVTVLQPTEVTTCTGTHTVTQAEADAGLVSNTAFVTGKPPVGAPLVPVPSNTVGVAIVAAPRLGIVKATTQPGVSRVGETIVYTFEVTNTGNVTMSAVTVNDPQVSGLSCLAATLAPAATTACTGTHTVTQTDLDAGSVVNTASAVATPPIGGPILPVPSNTVTVPAAQTAGILVVKATTTASVAMVGDAIRYTFTVTNAGNVTLTAVGVTDPNATGISCPATMLAPSASAVCTGIHTVTQTDLDAGSVVNIARAVGTPPSGTPLTPVDSNPITVPVRQNPLLTISKRASVPSYAAVGDTIPYTFVVTNTGNVTMTAITVTDPITATVTCVASTLLPGFSTSCAGSRTATQADLDAGTIVNTAQVIGTPPSGPPIAAIPSNTVTVPAVQNPSLTISKSTTQTAFTTIGDQITYSFTVTNTGNVTLTAVTVQDPNASGLTCAPTTLAPGATSTCSAVHQVTQAELDAGSVVNTAAARAVPPSGTALPPVLSNTVTVPAVQAPSITIVKSTTQSSISSVGATVTYRFTVRNTGNVSLTAVTVSDPNTTSVTCAVTSLAPGQQTTCTGVHTVTLADLDAGSVVNTASVVATPPSGTPMPSVPSNTVTLPATQGGALSIAKTADTTEVENVGDIVTYTFRVTNSGNVTLTAVTVDDPYVTGLTCAATALVPGASTTCTAVHVTTQQDLTNGSLVNTATATATPPNGTPLPRVDSNTVTITARQNPTLTMVKSTTATEFRGFGDGIAYTFVVRNTGNVPVTNLVVTDPNATDLTCAATALAPGASTTCTAIHTVTVADLVALKVVNTAIVRATPPSGTPTTPVPSNTVTVLMAPLDATVISLVAPTTLRPEELTTSTTTVVQASTTTPGTGRPAPTIETGVRTPENTPATPAPEPSIKLDKRATSKYSAVGDVIRYTFEITNTGSTPLIDVKVNDTMAGLSDVECAAFDGQLAAGASVTCSARYTVTAADIARGSIDNTATATGETPGCAGCAKSASVLGASTARSAVGEPSALPFTGAQASALALLAAALLLSGTMLVAVTRRRRRS